MDSEESILLDISDQERQQPPKKRKAPATKPARATTARKKKAGEYSIYRNYSIL